MLRSTCLIASLLVARGAASAENSTRLRGSQAAGPQSHGAKCDIFMWPDATKCGTCQARVAKFPHYGTCSRYCASLGLGCQAAWAAGSGPCDKAEALPCDAGMGMPGSGGSPAAVPGGICECSLPEGETQFDRCGTHRWPDVKEKCAACMVQVSGPVLKSKYGGKCANYCSSLNGQVYGQQWFCGQSYLGACSADPGAQRGASPCMHPVADGQDAVCWCVYPDF